MGSPLLEVSNLCAHVSATRILHDISFGIGEGEIHVLMGPNGSGKSTLAQTIMGNPVIVSASGTILFAGEDITHVLPDARVRKGLFASFQHPVEIPDVGMVPYMRSVLAAQGVVLDPPEIFQKDFVSSLERAGLAAHFAERSINAGFSGGEKKRNELFQLMLMRPRLAIIDEIDSGLDKDGVDIVMAELTRFVKDGGSLLVITHSPHLAVQLQPQRVYIMKEGTIVEQGGKELLQKIDARGFGL